MVVMDLLWHTALFFLTNLPRILLRFLSSMFAGWTQTGWVSVWAPGLLFPAPARLTTTPSAASMTINQHPCEKECAATVFRWQDGAWLMTSKNSSDVRMRTSSIQSKSRERGSHFLFWLSEYKTARVTMSAMRLRRWRNVGPTTDLNLNQGEKDLFYLSHLIQKQTVTRYYFHWWGINQQQQQN